MKYRTKKNYFLSLILIVCTFLMACTGKKTAVELGNEQQILHRGNATEPEDLDPHIVAGVPEHHILMGLFEGLVTFDSKTLKIIPGMAKSWDISQDGKVYTFHLREDAKWSNGEALTAKDFIFSVKRVLSRNLGAPYADRFYAIEGAEDYHKGNSDDFSKVGIKALDDHTLQITLLKPLPYFLTLISFMAWYPVHPDTILKYGKIDQRGSGWTRPGNMVSNGPFKLKSWDLSNKLVIERNPYYWNNENVKLNEIHFYPISDANTEERAFRSGQLHITETLPLSKVDSYKKTPYLFLAPYFSTYAYAFNTKKPPFDDKRVRHALSLAIDRNAIIENVTKRNESPAFSFVPTGAKGYHTTAKLEENVKKAQELLAEAGYPNGEGFPTVTILYNTSDAHKSIAEAMQYMWEKNLNIHVELVNQEWKVFLKSRAGNEYNLFRLGWVGDYLDPNAFLDIFTTRSGNNMSGWSNADYDAYVDKANSTLDEKKRFEYFDKAENILMDELPIMPIYFYNSAYLIQPSVKNWYPNLIDFHLYDSIYLDGSKTTN